MYTLVCKHPKVNEKVDSEFDEVSMKSTQEKF
jgi:hypothetical protein